MGCDSNDSSNRNLPNNTAILVGPHGCGKTSAVYAIANELGCKVRKMYHILETIQCSESPLHLQNFVCPFTESVVNVTVTDLISHLPLDVQKSLHTFLFPENFLWCFKNFYKSYF